jgi:3-oxosteroid 1-dehydrogenase
VFFDFDSQFQERLSFADRQPGSPIPDDSQFQERLSFADRQPGSPIPDWVSRGDSVSALAGTLGIDARGLDETVRRFNKFAGTGVDEDFHRGEKRWSVGAPESQGTHPRLGSIAKAPFYGLRLHPSAFASAGLLANGAARILHQRHHLYAVGNAVVHNEYGVAYQAGHSLTSGMTFGYLAALHIRDGSNALTPCYL